MSVELQENPTIKPVKKTRAKKSLKIETIEAPPPKEPEPPAPPSPEPEPEPELQFELEDTDTERGNAPAVSLDVKKAKLFLSSIDGPPAQIQKVKKPRTPKQIEAFEKARKIRSEKAVQRKAEQDAMMKEAYRIADEEQKKAVKEMQDVIVEKAVKIKKNQIKKIKELDENSVDVGAINKIVNPYHEFRNKFNIR